MSSAKNTDDVPRDSPGKGEEVTRPVFSAPPPGPGDPKPETIDDIKAQLAQLELQMKQRGLEAEYAHAERQTFAIKSVHLFQEVLNAGGEIPEDHLAGVTKLMDEVDEGDAKRAGKAPDDDPSSGEDAMKKT